MEVITTPSPPVFLKKLVSRSNLFREKLRDEYATLLIEALQIIATLDIRNSKGIIIENGASIIDKVLILERKGKDISAEIEIIGKDKWLKLKQIWSRLRELEKQDKFLISRL